MLKQISHGIVLEQKEPNFSFCKVISNREKKSLIVCCKHPELSTVNYTCSCKRRQKAKVITSITSCVYVAVRDLNQVFNKANGFSVAF